ncbi:MAG: CapA family protein [Bacteroidales bacterium]
MNRISGIAVFIILLLSAANPEAAGQPSQKLTLLFAGDIMGHDSQIESALNMGNGLYDYSSCFRYVEPYISRADIAIGNLEVTLAGPPYKGYPAFSSPDELAEALKKTGFDILVNANNHSLDRRSKGLERTLDVLDTTGLIQTGVFRDALERRLRYPLIVEKNRIRLALLNYTYGTNGIPVTPPNIVNYIDTTEIKNDLRKAATAEPDFTIVLMHWGLEYQLTENSSQIELAKFLFKNGADAIIGSHPHVVQPIRKIEGGKLVVYSLGNMISNQRKRYSDGGILVELTLEKSDSTRITDYSYLPVWVHKPVTEKGTAFSLVPATMDSLSLEQLNFTQVDLQQMNIFLDDTRGNLKGVKELR